jgi:hypothetical protein
MKCAIPSPLTFELNRYIVCNAKLKFVREGSEDLLFQLCRRPDGTSDVRRFIPLECNSNDGGDTYKGPQTYLTFKKRFEEIRANYRALNPFVECGVAGESCKLGPDDDNGLHPSVKEFLRGGVISIWAIWEAFVKDVLAEAFDEVVRQLREKDDDQRKTFAENLATRLFIPRPIHTRKSQTWFINDELLAEEPFQTDDVEEHKRNVLLTVYALLSHVNKEKPQNGSCIDKMFKQLLYPNPVAYLSITEFQLSTYIPLKDMSYEHILRKSDQKIYFLINDINLLHNLLCLYYGFRNSFCHGNNERTVTKGALSHFPSTTQEMEDCLRAKATVTVLVTPEQAGGTHEPRLSEESQTDECIKELSSEIVGIYESVRNEGRCAYVDYLTLLNMNRFILRVAHLLPVAIAKVTREHFQIRLWRYDFDEFGDH